MPIQNNITELSSETKIIFTIKMFLSTIVSIITIFASFYMVAISPKFDDHKEDIKEINNRIELMNEKLIEINSGIGIINGNIEGINNRFKDLNAIREDHQNSGGSFGN